MASSNKLKRLPHLCLVCGVDSGPIRTFLLLFIGALVGASLLSMLWAYLTGRLKDRSEMGMIALDAEEREHERTD